MGYYVHKETYTNNTGSDVYIKGMIFAMQNYWNGDNKQTVDITDIQNNHLYYAIIICIKNVYITSTVVIPTTSITHIFTEIYC